MNPRNPYRHEISFDQHVWLPSTSQNYRSIVDLIEDRDFVEKLIKSRLEVALHITEHSPVASNKILSALSETDIAKVRKKIADLGDVETRHSLISIGSHHFPEMRGKMQTTTANPPDHIHRMQRGQWYIGDLYSADMVGSSLANLGISFAPRANYLDFGCSSGSLIRALKAFSPESVFHGVDPIVSSIEWAQRHIPGSHFSVSDTVPPLKHEAGSFQGVTAISIWSHLGENEALAWFDEMHRVIEDGGWLFFTTHGDSAISYFNRDPAHSTRRILALLEGLINNDYVFEEVYLGKSPEGLSATGYGNAYFRRSWVERNLSKKWEIVHFGAAENQGNQDVYVLKKLPSTLTSQISSMVTSPLRRVWRKKTKLSK
ncbi:class I SAM-dependent methyltransferase [Ensifer sp. SSB1]|uniref:class I SAM-dependent methyltransferase n=1 Tax=Ensifer sp. SSB1 TaxID=2795385 RepID=UPI001A569AEE|nr:class I SAM-dependent methyltransferase [Ensifer sp. SSB1]MBK5571639.1 class I SAM-dependent methyltransferase [Ensifer sp. SSB1]